MRFTATIPFFLALGFTTVWGFSWNKYYELDEIYEYLHDVAAAYPEQVEVVSAGQSYENVTQLGLKISSNLNDVNRKIVMIESGIHSREWITPAVTTYFINQMFNSTNSSITALRDAVEWHIFPSVNPDGYRYSFHTDRYWRKSRSESGLGCYGADLNRNFDYHWDETISVDPCGYEVYSGSKPFSEIESQNLAAYVDSISPRLAAYIGLHSFEQCVYVPYGDSTEHVWNYDSMVEVGKAIVSYAASVAGNEWCGPATAAEVSYPAQGMSPDWVYYKYNISLSYTIEMRGLDFVFPEPEIHVQGDEFTMMMLGMITKATEIGVL